MRWRVREVSMRWRVREHEVEGEGSEHEVEGEGSEHEVEGEGSVHEVEVSNEPGIDCISSCISSFQYRLNAVVGPARLPCSHDIFAAVLQPLTCYSKLYAMMCCYVGPLPPSSC